MNFLAHLYLSPSNPEILIGNFIADVVKGKQYEAFSSDIQKGIILHRKIDTFTDQHPIHKQSRNRLHKRYGHYRGVIIDMFYDHFCKTWNNYSNIPLDIYAQSFYKLLHSNHHILPEKTQFMLPYLEKYDWLYNYQFFEGMKAVLEGMNRRTQLKSHMDLAIDDLKNHYSDFESDFTLFFDELISYTKNLNS